MSEPDEHKLLRDTDREAKAQRLLDDEMFKEAFDALESEYTAAWRNTGIMPQDTYARERLWQAINLLGKVKGHLRKVIENGKLARRELNEIEGKRGRPLKAA